MPEDIEENVIVKAILDKFLQDIATGTTISHPILVTEIAALKNQNKIARGITSKHYSPMKLKSLSIREIRGIRKFDRTLDGRTLVICGDNGTEKWNH